MRRRRSTWRRRPTSPWRAWATGGPATRARRWAAAAAASGTVCGTACWTAGRPCARPPPAAAAAAVLCAAAWGPPAWRPPRPARPARPSPCCASGSPAGRKCAWRPACSWGRRSTSWWARCLGPLASCQRCWKPRCRPAGLLQ